MKEKLVIMIVKRLYTETIRPILVEYFAGTENKLDDKIVLILDFVLETYIGKE